MAEIQSVRKTRRPGTRRYRLTRAQYDRMIEAGVLDEDKHVQLIEGELIEMSPQGSRHYACIMLVYEALRSNYPAGWHVRIQAPMALDPDSEPEPDVSVVSGTPRDYLDEHPKTAVLVVEVADSTILSDRRRKVRLYARHRIPEYWIINLKDDSLEVYREPGGETYGSKVTLRRGESVQPAGAVQPISVAYMLP